MSSLNYSYYSLQDVALDLKIKTKEPTIMAFGNLLLRVSEILKEVDRYFNSNSDIERVNKQIEICLGKDYFEKITIETLNEEAKRIIDQLQTLIWKTEQSNVTKGNF